MILQKYFNMLIDISIFFFFFYYIINVISVTFDQFNESTE